MIIGHKRNLVFVLFQKCRILYKNTSKALFGPNDNLFSTIFNYYAQAENCKMAQSPCWLYINFSLAGCFNPGDYIRAGVKLNEGVRIESL